MLNTFFSENRAG